MGKEAICDNCWPRGVEEHKVGQKEHRACMERMVFQPIQTESGIWVTGEGVSFSELHRFIYACISRPGAAPEFAHLLVNSSDAILGLIDLLESRIADPLENPGYMSLLQEEGKLHAEIVSLSRHRQELEKAMAKPRHATTALQKLAKRDGTLLSEDQCELKLNRARLRLQVVRDDANNLIAKLIQRDASTARREAVRQLRSDLAAARFTKGRRDDVRPGDSIWSRLPPPLPRSSQLDLELRAVNPPDQRSEPGAAGHSRSGGDDQPPHQAGEPLEVSQVPWIILEPQHTSLEDVLGHYSTLSRIRKQAYDIERLRFVHNFKPTEIYVGKAAFEGYVVFCFGVNGRAVLECPITGNATYLMQLPHWKQLSKLSKTELLVHHTPDVSRIIHGVLWQEELRLWIEHGGLPLFDFERADH